MPKRSDQHKHEKKQQLLKTASELFKEKGYNNTSVNDIVKAAKVSKGSFYTHYDSKETLFFDIVQGDDKEIINLKALFSYEKSDNPLGDYINFRLRRFFEEENRVRAKYTYEFWSSTTLTSNQILDLNMRYKHFESEITSLINLGKEKAIYRKDVDSKSLIQLLIGTIDGLIVLDTVLYKPINEDVIEMVIDMFDCYLRHKRGRQ